MADGLAQGCFGLKAVSGSRLFYVEALFFVILQAGNSSSASNSWLLFIRPSFSWRIIGCSRLRQAAHHSIGCA
ncbi:hypothetical protein [Endozoicomonas sp. YOMI1]|uniref:hypothetical protein n=1 Tax=Endozoicomonas sp. YOMI1 TaxID=2828739 RepID=UPI002147BE12|nr:hypothetical protein [Endozoicomonas sp. YOMI1]